MILAHQTLDLFDKMLFERATLCPPFKRQVPMPNEACFLYVLDGGYHSYSEEGTMTVQAKEGILMKCGNYLGRFFSTSESKEYKAIAVHFYPEVLKKIYESGIPDFLKNPTPSKIGMTKVKSDELLKRYIESILFYFENPQLASEELMVLKLKELILILNETRNAPEIQLILSSLFSPTTYSFKEVIEAHLYSNITIQELAQLTNLSESSFKREFKKAYDDSPANYLRQQKLRKAEELLLVSELNVTQITFECGFNDVAHFSRLFKNKYGQSPSNYRLNQMNKPLT
ncbi:hypothetical protein BKI52_06495 [marine bacterium AO1-C]|nr:hypothetical protein BKI52_06495 [marine bacterium AO1-C]